MAKDADDLLSTKYKLITSTPEVEYWRKRAYGDDSSVMIHGRVGYSMRANLAQQFVDRWGMVAGIPDGEDSAGRQKLRLATPAELAARAVESANALFDAMDAAGWKIDVPSFTEFMPDPKSDNH